MPSHLINLRTATVTNSFYFMLYVGAHEYSVNGSESQIYCPGVFSINQIVPIRTTLCVGFSFLFV
mgnify:CR=1 FL=1